MNFGNLKTLSRKFTPSAKTTRITDDELELLINEAAIDVAFRLVALKKSKKINVSAEKGEYYISDTMTDYLTMDRSGVWWYNGTSWRQLTPFTLKQLDIEFRQWRDDSSSSPLRYYIDGDILGLHPKPDTTLTSGLWVYYGRKPLLMTDSGDYPFHKDGTKTIEIPQLSILSDSIFAYLEWHFSKILSKPEQEIIALNQVYEKEIASKKRLIEMRADISAYKKTKFQGRKVRR